MKVCEILTMEDFEAGQTIAGVLDLRVKTPSEDNPGSEGQSQEQKKKLDEAFTGPFQARTFPPKDHKRSHHYRAHSVPWPPGPPDRPEHRQVRMCDSSLRESLARVVGNAETIYNLHTVTLDQSDHDRAALPMSRQALLRRRAMCPRRICYFLTDAFDGFRAAGTVKVHDGLASAVADTRNGFR